MLQPSSRAVLVDKRCLTPRVAMGIAYIFVLVGLRASTNVMLRPNYISHVSDFLFTMQADGRVGIQNITEFPAFMLQWPADPTPTKDHEDSCDVTDAAMPHIFNITSYPATYDKDVVFEALVGNLTELWDDANAIAIADVGMEFGAKNANQDQAPADNHPIRTVVCTPNDSTFILHFPHLMEHILQCWSLWRTFPKARRVLLVKRRIQQHITKTSSFSAGIGKLLEAKNISIIPSPAQAYVAKHKQRHHEMVIAFSKQLDYRAVYDDDVADFRRSMLQVHGLEGYHAQFCERMGSVQSLQPRIAILNREGNRRVLRAHSISQHLQEALDLPYRPPVLFFESMSFSQQIESLANIDILVTPHGAQLTGIPFLPRCSSVIEIFPDQYGPMEFFGTLAAISKVNHSFVYLGQGQIPRMSSLTPEQRQKSREPALCAPQQALVRAVRIQMEQWRRCCGFID